MIPDDIIEQVREAADLVGIIGEHVELKRTGSDFRGPCPFHGGTHRNFAVIPKKGRYYCFVCHESGDVFSWPMKRLGLDYPTAVREVARRVGIVIPERAARSGPDPLEPLFGAVAVAQDWFTRQLLECNGYTVIEAPNGASALALVDGGDQLRVDLLLTDVIMPGMSGRELATELVARLPKLRVLYMSGYTDDAVVRHGMLEPGLAYLEKPFRPAILLRKVRAALDTPL